MRGEVIASNALSKCPQLIVNQLCTSFVDAATKNLLIAALHCAGVRLVQECPSRALSSLACANSIDEPDDEMDDLEAEVEEALAA